MADAILPDAAARLSALTDHGRTLLVEAGAGSGKTAIMAGRVALLIAAGARPAEIVAITFTEAAAAELQERIERFVGALLAGESPIELREALAAGLSADQRAQLEAGSGLLDEITCTTIHGFCKQLVKPYPVETGIDPGAAIIDPAAAELAYQDLVDAWLSARFGRDRGAQGVGRIPAIAGTGAEEDFFTELLLKAPDQALELIKKTAVFLKTHRTVRAPEAAVDSAIFQRLADAVAECATWYDSCGLAECTTCEFIDDMAPLAAAARKAACQPLSGRRIAELLFHCPPKACKKDEIAFKKWGRKGKWKEAAKAAGQSGARGDQLSAAGEARYLACEAAYQQFCAALGSLAFQRFIKEFDPLRQLYREYKRTAALLDFDDLLYHACTLLKTNEPVRQALAQRYPRILVDEFQDTDPLQAEILWRLAGEGDPALCWQERVLRPGALFLVGDPKQAIYRFRGADVATYLAAKQALVRHDPAAVLTISANFRCREQILQFVNERFAGLLDESRGQPGFTALSAVRRAGDQVNVGCFDIAVDERLRTPKGDLAVDAVRREEAAVVAELAGRLIGGFPVHDKEQKGFRPARAGDIALLAPTGTSLWIYEQALEARHIPIATQAGKGFFRRQEVQDLIAVTRVVADPRDTLALGALLRGPLVGLTEEELADEIQALKAATGQAYPLHLWTDPDRVRHPVFKQILCALQNLASKARHATPYQLLAEAVEQLQVRSILKARHRRGAERALANVELVLEMARAYAARGIVDFARALRDRWQDGEAQAEGRPDAMAEAVSIITIHSAKGLEWPIVIPINSMTTLWSDTQFLYRRSDDTVHFKVFGYPGPDFETVCQQESEELRRERVRLWYVALTRARDLLLLPRQSERKANDWFSLLDIDLGALAPFDASPFAGGTAEPGAGSANTQDIGRWERQAAAIAAAQHRIEWHLPSRYEAVAPGPGQTLEEVFAGTEAYMDRPAADTQTLIQGGRQRGLILHKLIEEVLTGETAEDELAARAGALLAQLGLADGQDPAHGPSSREMAQAVTRALRLPQIVALRPHLLPELRLYGAGWTDHAMELTAGIADAAAVDENGRIHTIIDWKSDVDPTSPQIDHYRDQVRDYLAACGAQTGLIVFLTSGRIERVERPSGIQAGDSSVTGKAMAT